MKEATEALVKQQGLTEGVWFIGFDFSLGAGMAGATPEEIRPTAFLQISRVLLVRFSGQGEPPPFAVDAADLIMPVKPAPRRRVAKAEQKR